MCNVCMALAECVCADVDLLSQCDYFYSTERFVEIFLPNEQGSLALLALAQQFRASFN